MIARITGKIIQKGNNFLLLDINGISYEVLLPLAIMQRIDERGGKDDCVTLVTYHYYQLEPSRSTPVLIGFLNEIEKEFFEQFITVSGIGPRAALRALNKPISIIARAIDEGDIDFLKTLPGIGQQRAKEIVAKLQGKVGKFGLVQDHRVIREEAQKNITEEALAVLLQLQYKKSEAEKMVKAALERTPELKTAEDLLNEIYKQRKEL